MELHGTLRVRTPTAARFAYVSKLTARWKASPLVSTRKNLKRISFRFFQLNSPCGEWNTTCVVWNSYRYEIRLAYVGEFYFITRSVISYRKIFHVALATFHYSLYVCFAEIVFLCDKHETGNLIEWICKPNKKYTTYNCAHFCGFFCRILNKIDILNAWICKIDWVPALVFRHCEACIAEAIQTVEALLRICFWIDLSLCSSQWWMAIIFMAIGKLILKNFRGYSGII